MCLGRTHGDSDQVPLALQACIAWGTYRWLESVLARGLGYMPRLLRRFGVKRLLCWVLSRPACKISLIISMPIGPRWRRRSAVLLVDLFHSGRERYLAIHTFSKSREDGSNAAVGGWPWALATVKAQAQQINTR